MFEALKLFSEVVVHVFVLQKADPVLWEREEDCRIARGVHVFRVVQVPLVQVAKRIVEVLQFRG